MTEHFLVKELKDQGAQRSKTETPQGENPFEWRKSTLEWRAAVEIERLLQIIENGGDYCDPPH